MGKFTVGEAILPLLQEGIRVQRGYPGTLMPQLTDAVAAVNIHKSEPSRVTMIAMICAPMSMGMYACENLAAKVAEVWTAAEGVCTYGDHGFDGKSGIYTMKVYGIWEDASEDSETTEESTA